MNVIGHSGNSPRASLTIGSTSLAFPLEGRGVMGKEEEYFPHASQTSTDPASIGNCRRCLLRFERLIDNSTLAHSFLPSLPSFSFSHSPLKSPPLLEIGGAAVRREEDATSWCIDGMCTNKLTRTGDPTSATTFISSGARFSRKNLLL